jgi:hypothetical protein
MRRLFERVAGITIILVSLTPNAVGQLGQPNWRTLEIPVSRLTRCRFCRMIRSFGHRLIAARQVASEVGR